MSESSSPVAARKRHNLNYASGAISALSSDERFGPLTHDHLTAVADDLAALAREVAEMRQEMRDIRHRAVREPLHSDDWSGLVRDWERRLGEVA